MIILNSKLIQLLKSKGYDLYERTTSFINFYKYGGDKGWSFHAEQRNGGTNIEIHFGENGIRNFYTGSKEIVLNRDLRNAIWFFELEDTKKDICRICKGHGFVLDCFDYPDNCTVCNDNW